MKTVPARRKVKDRVIVIQGAQHLSDLLEELEERLLVVYFGSASPCLKFKRCRIKTMRKGVLCALPKPLIFKCVPCIRDNAIMALREAIVYTLTCIDLSSFAVYPSGLS